MTSDGGAGLPLIATKLIPPLGSRRPLARPTLIGRLDRARRKKLVTIAAPAGYGKTTTLAAWHRHLTEAGARTAWLSLDAADRDQARFAAYFLAALARPQNGEPALLPFAGPGLSATALIDRVLAALSAEAARDAGETWVFLDDAHVLSGGGAADLLSAIVTRAPTGMHVAMASRETPPFSVARLRAAGDLAEFSGADLRFDAEETAAFLALAAERAIGREVSDAIRARTEGWAAGVQLAALHLDERTDASEAGGGAAAGLTPLSATAGPVHAFLADEVIGDLDQAIVHFLEDTSILSRLNSALCDAVTGTETGRAMLDELSRRNLFVASLDPDQLWYRYHPLFQEFLQARLSQRSPDIVRALHRRAATWLAEHGDIFDAIEHAFSADDAEMAAQLIVTRIDDFFYAGQYGTVMGWLNRLPDTLQEKHPRLRLVHAWVLMDERNFTDARRILTEVKATVNAMPDDGAGGERAKLHALLVHREGMLALFADDIVRAERLFGAYLADPLDNDPYHAASAEIAHAAAERELFGAIDADARIARAYTLMEKAGSRAGAVWCAALEGPMHVLAGELDRAERVYRKALDDAMAAAGAHSAVAALPGLQLAALCCERDKRVEAEALLSRYGDLADDLGFVDQLISVAVTHFRLANARGAFDEAARIADDARRTAAARHFPRLALVITEEEILALSARDETATARRIAESAGIGHGTEAPLPGPGASSLDEIRARAVARAAFLRGEITASAQVAKAWLRFAEEKRHRRAVIAQGAILIRALQAGGAQADARKMAVTILEAAAATGFVRLLADQGRPLMGAIAKALGTTALEGSVARHWQRIQRAAENKPMDEAPAAALGPTPELRAPTASFDGGPLGQREIQVLSGVAAGRINREIARDLGIAESTVNWHLRAIYQKLGVHRRAHAVTRAREHGYL